MQSVSPKTRLSRHKSNARSKSKNKNVHLSNAINKYGEDSFSFEVIAQCSTLEDSDETEIACIAQYKSVDRRFGYNSALGGQGKRPMSEETKAKLSKALKGRVGTFSGCNHSKEAKDKLSKASKGNKYRLGVKVSDQTRALLSKINTGKRPSKESLEKRSRSMKGKNIGPSNGMYGKRSHNSKLTKEQADDIRQEHATGNISMLKLAKKYSVSKRTILNIIHRKIYK